MTQLGNGLFEAGRYADSLSVMEAQLSLYRRIGASEHSILESEQSRHVGRLTDREGLKMLEMYTLDV